MATGPANPIARYVQEVVGEHETEKLSDGQLVQRFAAYRDEAAFRALLRRHQPMVYGVCRRLLRDLHQADDAFQATFLVLARRAGAIGRQEAVGAWLYRVAFRIAMRAKMRNDRQRLREEPVSDVPAPSSGEAVSVELRPILDEELNRLPKKYRDPIVLRYFEEKAVEVVAAQLSWPLGTVKTRLSKARDLLKARLARRGLALTAVALEAALGETTSAAVPVVLTEATAQAAMLAAAGQAAGTAGAILLTEGVLKEMATSKLTKTVFGALVLVGLLAGGVGWLLSDLRADKPGAPTESPAAPRRAHAPAVVPPELAWVPPDAPGFVSVQVDKLWDAEFGQELRRQIGEKSPLTKFIANVVANAEVQGILDLPNIRRLTVLVPPMGELPVADKDGISVAFAVTMRKPYERAKVLSALLEDAAAQKEDKNYYVGKSAGALYFVDAHTYLLFTQKVGSKLVPRLLSKKSDGKKDEGPLRGSLALAGSMPIVVALNTEPVGVRNLISLIKAEAKDNPLLQGFEPLARASNVCLSIAPGKELKADLFLNFPDRQSKDEGAKAVKLVLTMAEAGLAQLRQTIRSQPSQGSPVDLEQVGKFLGEIKVGLKAASVRQEGNRLHVPLRVATDDRTVATMTVAAVLLPFQIQEARARIYDVNNLKQIAIAMHQYHDKEQKFPTAAIYSKDGKPLLSWRVALLPYIGEESLYKEFKLDEPWDSEHNKKLLSRMPGLYLAALPRGLNKDDLRSHTFYQVFVGKGSIFEGKEPPTLAQVTNANGASNTVLVVEAGDAVPWTKPLDLRYIPDRPLPKMGGDAEAFPAVFADGHVQQLPKKWFEKNAKFIINWQNTTALMLP